MQKELEQDVEQRIAKRKSPMFSTVIEDEEEDTPKHSGKRRPPMITRNANGRLTPKITMLQSTKILPSAKFEGLATCQQKPALLKQSTAALSREMNYDNLVYGESIGSERRISTQQRNRIKAAKRNRDAKSSK